MPINNERERMLSSRQEQLVEWSIKTEAAYVYMGFLDAEPDLRGIFYLVYTLKYQNRWNYMVFILIKMSALKCDRI